MGILFEKESFAIRGAIYEVHNQLGCGFLEAVYQESLEIELKDRNIPFSSQQELTLYYKGSKLSQMYKPDFICFDRIIVEIKATKEIAPEHKAQVLNYLKASKLQLGFLVNFGSHPKATIERFVL